MAKDPKIVEPVVDAQNSTAADVDAYVVPALQDLGMGVEDIHYLANTHSHGDHFLQRGAGWLPSQHIGLFRAEGRWGDRQAADRIHRWR